MQLFATWLIAGCSLVIANVNHGGAHQAWIRDFDNLVAFGDRYGSGIPPHHQGAPH